MLNLLLMQVGGGEDPHAPTMGGVPSYVDYVSIVQRVSEAGGSVIVLGFTVIVGFYLVWKLFNRLKHGVAVDGVSWDDAESGHRGHMAFRVVGGKAVTWGGKAKNRRLRSQSSVGSSGFAGRTAARSNSGRSGGRKGRGRKSGGDWWF